MPWVAAKASVISSSLNCSRARSHLLRAGRVAKTSSMLARSTAWRQGLKPDLGEEHVDQVDPAVADQQVGRLDVAVGEAGDQPADDAQPVVDDGLVDLLQVADLRESSKNSKVIRYSRSGVISTIPKGWGCPGPVEQPQGVVLLLDEGGGRC